MVHLKNNIGMALVVGTAGGIALLIGQSSVLVTPVIMSSLIRGLELSASRAGYLVTLEMLTLAFSTLILASYIGKVSKTKMFTAGMLVLVTGHLFAAFSDVIILIILGRVLVGLGGGMMVTVANATMASSADPERFFSIAFVTSALLTAIALIMLSIIAGQYNHAGVFVFLAALAIVGIVFCRPLLQGGYASSQNSAGRSRHPPLAYLTLLALFIYYCGAGSVWAFAEQKGHHLEIESVTIGLVLSAVTVGGLLSGSVAAWLSTRAGRAKPLVVCATLQVFSIFFFSVSTTTFQYSVSLMLATVSLYFIMPYLIGVAAMFGENGRWGAAGGGASLLGLAISATVGGMLVDWGGYKMIGIAFSIMGPIATLTLLFVIYQHGKSNMLTTNLESGGVQNVSSSI